MRFRRREPLHERLAREGGLLEHDPADTYPRWGEAGIHGIARPRAWDVVLPVEAALAGDEARFAALPDGSLAVESGPADVEPLAAALDGALDPPYRAEAVRRGPTSWAVAARRIRTLELAGQDGEELELTIGPEGRRLVVDGEPRLGSLPALEQLVGGAGHVRARRLGGETWEVEAARL